MRATVDGRVVIPGPKGETPAPGVLVTIHRVGPDSAGPLDSARTGADGRFRVGYRRFGSDEAVYFAAAVYSGIAYFSAPLHGLRSTGDDASITVFDTTSGRVPFTIQGHHIVVSAPGATGDRRIVEIYELSNDTTVTAVGHDSLTAVWSAPIPRGLREFAGGQGDVSPTTLAVRDGRVVLMAPFGPGVKQLSFSYVLGDGDFPLRDTLERYTGVLEVLLEEQGAQARSPSLRAQDDVTTQGHSYKRLLAQGAQQGEMLRIDVPTVALARRTRVFIGLGIVIVLAMLGALARALLRRDGGTRLPAAPAPSPSAPLVAAIAALDARHDAGDTLLDDAAWRAQRAALKTALAAALAAERES